MKQYTALDLFTIEQLSSILACFDRQVDARAKEALEFSRDPLFFEWLPARIHRELERLLFENSTPI